MTIPAGDTTTSVALTELSERQRERALERYRKLRPHLEQDAPLADVAKEASLPLRTAQRWVSRYRQFGLIGLIRAGRTDQGKRRRVPDDLRRLAEGLALERPPLGPSAIYREICRILMKEPHLGQVARVIAQYHALADIGREGGGSARDCPEILDHKRQFGQDVCRTERRTLVTLIGYARVSTLDQDPALQLDALAAAGCTRVFDDRASGARADRPGLRQALDYVRDGDVLVVWKLDRLGRSLAHLIETVTALEQRGISFRSITEAIDTTTPGGRLVFHLFGALGQFERDLIRERTRAGLAAAAARGRKGGRKPAVDAVKLARARGMVAKGLTVREAAIRLKVGKTALYEALRLAAGENTPPATSNS